MINLKKKNLFKQQCFIDGKWLDAHTGKTDDVLNPSNSSILGTVPRMGSEETEMAIQAAYKAQSEWRAKTAEQRSKLLKNWHRLILENAEDLAVLMTSEQGKPLAESLAEINYGASYIEWFAEEAKRIYGDVIPAKSNKQRIMVTKEPVGVVAAITPWNFPNAMITRKCAPALAVGCTIVIKPAPDTPLSALALCVLAHEAGIPNGVINCVTGDAVKIGETLTKHKLVKKLSFTGSTAVGKLLLEQCADTVKKVSLELGGNAPFIVFDDADIDSAVQGAIASKFRNTGQTCVCTNRFLVHEKVEAEFTEKFKQAIESLKCGDGLEKNSTQGPLITKAAFDKVSAHVEDALNKGAQLQTGGEQHSLGGLFYKPTLLTKINSDMLVTQEETFGPVAAVTTFKTEEEAISIANDTLGGLASYVYTKDLGRALRVSEALEFGMVGVNEGILSSEAIPFGGIKEAGLGREGSHYGADDYLEIKYVLLGGL